MSIPRELLNELGIVPGEASVHFALNPAMPGTLIVIPSATLARIMPTLLEALSDVGR